MAGNVLFCLCGPLRHTFAISAVKTVFNSRILQRNSPQRSTEESGISQGMQNLGIFNLTGLYRLLCILILSCLISHISVLHSQTRLVVGIVIDQMRYDYLERYRSRFGPDGFNKLIQQGFSCTQAHYNYVPTFTAPGHASIYTGTTPAEHGIVGNNWVLAAERKRMYCVDDPAVFPVGTTSSSGKMSPANLLVPTLTDLLQEKTKGLSRVIGISMKDRGAILPAGKKGDAAYWFDASTGYWISSSYYFQKLPVWVDQFNQRELAKKYLSGPWNTLYPVNTYTASDADDAPGEDILKGKVKSVFPYDLPSLMKQNGGLGLIRETPFGNTLTREFACDAVVQEQLGRDSIVDFLCISFSPTDYIGHTFGPNSVEIEDTYLRLDKEIAELIRFLEEQVGKQHLLIFLTSDHGAPSTVPHSQRAGRDAQVIYEKTVADSLRRFYRRTYKDTLLLTVNEFDIYLNRRRIESRGLNLAEISKSTATYLQTFPGIARAIVPSEPAQPSTSGADTISDMIRAGYQPQRSGDVIFVLRPWWLMGYPRGTQHGSPYAYDTHVPLIFYGGGIRPGSMKDRIEITDIVPTLAARLNILIPQSGESNPFRQGRIITPVVR